MQFLQVKKDFRSSRGGKSTPKSYVMGVANFKNHTRNHRSLILETLSANTCSCFSAFLQGIHSTRRAKNVQIVDSMYERVIWGNGLKKT